MDTPHIMVFDVCTGVSGRMFPKPFQGAAQIVEPKWLLKKPLSLASIPTCCSDTSQDEDVPTDSEHDPMSSSEKDKESACGNADSSCVNAAVCTMTSMEGRHVEVGQIYRCHRRNVSFKDAAIPDTDVIMVSDMKSASRTRNGKASEWKAIRRIPRVHEFNELLDLESLNEEEMRAGTFGLGMRRSPRCHNFLDLCL